MKELIEDIRPDIVMHFAAQAINGISYETPYLTIDTNIRGTLNILEAIRQAGLLNTRFLLAGSSTVYGKTADIWNGSIPEIAPFAPVSPYGVSKASSELLALQYYHAFGLPVIIARFFIQVGIGGTDSLAIQEFAKQVAMIEKGLVPPVIRHGNINAERDMTDIRISAPVIVKLAERGVPGESYNVGTGSAVSIKSVLLEMIAQAKINITVEEDTRRQRQYDEKILIANISKLNDIIAWQPKFNLENVAQSLLMFWRAKVDSRYINHTLSEAPQRVSLKIRRNCSASSQNLQISRILITGVNGLIGSHVAKELVQNPKHVVYGMIRLRSDLRNLVL